MKISNQSFSKFVACVTLLLALGSCSGGGSDGGGTTQAPLTVTSGTSFPSSPVRIRFRVTNFTIGLPGTPHLRFSIDGGALHDFYNGAGIGSEGLNSGVRLSGDHTHFVHWTSTTSFTLFALPAGDHDVRLVLVDASDTELTNAGAATTHDFTVLQPQTGDLQLEPVLEGLDFPVGLSLAEDGRIFYNERLTGKIRIINPGWQLNPNACVTIPVAVSGEQGLLGLTLDPNFDNNHYVYVYYTVKAAGVATMNRVVRYTESNGVCSNGTTVLDNLPTANDHNGGIIQFGPDGMLYVVIGDAENPLNAQNLTSLAGKILRVNPDGSAPADNPFFSNANANAKKVFSLGHRNSYGFTFHPETNHLWESENGRDDSDEINRVVAGRNYGWPTGMGILNQPGFVDPIAVFFPLPCTICVIAPTGIIAIPENSSVYPEAYYNNLLVAAWIDGTIRLVIPNGRDPDLPGTTSVAYNGGEGGLLSLMLGSDGYVYVSNVDGIFRVLLLRH
jgi:glucose/arabinose dehydrogenase